MEHLDYLVGAGLFPKAVVGDESIRGDAWQHTIGI
jgi:hypothetical protein